MLDEEHRSTDEHRPTKLILIFFGTLMVASVMAILAMVFTYENPMHGGSDRNDMPVVQTVP